MRSCLIDFPRFIPRNFLRRPLSLLRALHGLDRSLPGAPIRGRIEQIAVEDCGHEEDRDSSSRGTDNSFLGVRCGLGAETVADRLGQSRLIHLSSYAGDNLPRNIDPAYLFHETTLLQTMNSELPYRVRSRSSSRHPANRIKEPRAGDNSAAALVPPPPRISPAPASEQKKHQQDNQNRFHVVTSLARRSGPALVTTVLLLLYT